MVDVLLSNEAGSGTQQVLEVAIGNSEESVSIINSNGRPVVEVNGAVVPYPVSSDGAFDVEFRDAETVVVTDAAGARTLVSTTGGHMAVMLVSPGDDDREITGGMVGQNDGNPDNDFLDESGNVLTQPEDIVRDIIAETSRNVGDDTPLVSPAVDDLRDSTSGSGATLPPGSTVSFPDLDLPERDAFTLTSFVSISESSDQPMSVMEFVTEYGDDDLPGSLDVIAQEGFLILYVNEDFNNPTNRIEVASHNGDTLQVAVSVDTQSGTTTLTVLDEEGDIVGSQSVTGFYDDVDVRVVDVTTGSHDSDTQMVIDTLVQINDVIAPEDLRNRTQQVLEPVVGGALPQDVDFIIGFDQLPPLVESRDPNTDATNTGTGSVTPLPSDVSETEDGDSIMVVPPGASTGFPTQTGEMDAFTSVFTLTVDTSASAAGVVSDVMTLQTNNGDLVLRVTDGELSVRAPSGVTSSGIAVESGNELHGHITFDETSDQITLRVTDTVTSAHAEEAITGVLPAGSQPTVIERIDLGDDDGDSDVTSSIDDISVLEEILTNDEAEEILDRDGEVNPVDEPTLVVNINFEDSAGGDAHATVFNPDTGSTTMVTGEHSPAVPQLQPSVVPITPPIVPTINPDLSVDLTVALACNSDTSRIDEACSATEAAAFREQYMTACLRDAQEAQELLDRLVRLCGLQQEIVEGEEEADVTSTRARVGVLYDNHIQTLDGQFLTHIDTGVYRVTEVSTGSGSSAPAATEVQAVFEPAPGNPLSRVMTAVNVDQGSTNIDVTIDAVTGSLVVDVEVDGDTSRVVYPVSTGSGGELAIDWSNRDTVTITDQDGQSYTVANVDNRLQLTMNVPPSNSNTFSGLLGDGDGDRLNDINHGTVLASGDVIAVSDEYFEENVNSAEYQANVLAQFEITDTDDVNVRHVDERVITGSTGSGYEVSLTDGHVVLDDLDTRPITEMTTTVHVDVTAPTDEDTNLLSIVTDAGTLHVVQNGDEVRLAVEVDDGLGGTSTRPTGDSLPVSTTDGEHNILIPQWDSTTGEATLVVVSPDGSISDPITLVNVFAGNDVVISDVILGDASADSGVRTRYDELVIVEDVLSPEAAVDLATGTPAQADSTSDLVLVSHFDDGVGGGVSVEVVESDGTSRTESGRLEPSAPHTQDSSLSVPGTDTGSSVTSGHGSLDYDVDTPAVDDFTVEVFVRPQVLPEGGSSTLVDVTLDNGDHVTGSVSGDELSLTYTDSDGNAHTTDPITLAEEEGVHVGLVFDSTDEEIVLIVDTPTGSPQTQTLPVADLPTSVAIDRVTIGGDTNDAIFEVDNFVVVDDALTAEEVETDGSNYGGTDSNADVILRNTFDDSTSSATSGAPAMTQVDEDGNESDVTGTSTSTAPNVVPSVLPPPPFIDDVTVALGGGSGGMGRVTEGEFDFETSGGDLLGGNVDDVTVTIDVIVEHSSGDENTILTTATSIGQVRVIEQDGSVRAEIDVNGDVTVTDTLPLPRLEDGSLGGSVGFSLDADSGELVAVTRDFSDVTLTTSDPATATVTGKLPSTMFHTIKSAM